MKRLLQIVGLSALMFGVSGCELIEEVQDLIEQEHAAEGERGDGADREDRGDEDRGDADRGDADRGDEDRGDEDWGDEDWGDEDWGPDGDCFADAEQAFDACLAEDERPRRCERAFEEAIDACLSELDGDDDGHGRDEDDRGDHDGECPDDQRPDEEWPDEEWPDEEWPDEEWPDEEWPGEDEGIEDCILAAEQAFEACLEGDAGPRACDEEFGELIDACFGQGEGEWPDEGEGEWPDEGEGHGDAQPGDDFDRAIEQCIDDAEQAVAACVDAGGDEDDCYAAGEEAAWACITAVEEALFGEGEAPAEGGPDGEDGVDGPHDEVEACFAEVEDALRDCVEGAETPRQQRRCEREAQAGAQACMPEAL